MNKLTDDNYLIYAAKNYQNPHCTSIEDFNNDCKKFITSRTLMRIYKKGRSIKLQLLLNHIIVCTNMFGPRATVNLFFFHCEEELYPILVTIFNFLNILPEGMYSDIEENDYLRAKLEDL